MNRSRESLRELDRAFAVLNTYLLALAIGLAVLDAASFAGMKYVELIE